MMNTGSTPRSAHEYGAAQLGAGRPSKRDRVALACQRCKIRKQKCDGVHPACLSCSKLKLKCEYVASLVPSNSEKKIYIKALEQRIAELESSLANYGHVGVGDDHWKQSPQAQTTQSQPQQLLPKIEEQNNVDDETDALTNVVRDLSLSASGHYVGGTSTITIGRLLSSVVNSQKAHQFEFEPTGSLAYEDPNPKSICAPSPEEAIHHPFLSPSVADRLLQGFLRHIATRFPVIHTPWLRELHANRDHLQDVYQKSILHLVYATGGRWIESTGEMGHFYSDLHYEAAVEHMDSILELHDSQSLNYLLLMAIYCTRAPRNPGAWTYTGLAMRLCIELGLHRRKKHRELSIGSELEKRRFWSCYFLDREVSIALGRPLAICDHDIDVELPLDIDEDIDDPQVIIQAGQGISDCPCNPPTSMTSFVHRIRLKRIESQIQHLIYRVDEPKKVSDAMIEGFLHQLSVWKDRLPLDASNYQDKPSQPFDGIDIYMVPYYRCIRLLLYPQLSESPVNMKYLKLCVDACGGVCRTYKRLHHQFSIGFSTLSIQSVFLAGLTLVYCAWLAPPNSVNLTKPLTDCSIVLYVMTERWPSARKYRDVFEEIKTAVTDLTENGMHQPRKAVEILDAQMRESCASLDQDLIGGLGEGLTQMISQMTGRSMGLLGNDMNFLAMASSSTPSLPLPPVVMHEQGPQLNDFEPGLSEYGETELDWTFPGAEFDAEGDCMR